MEKYNSKWTAGNLAVKSSTSIVKSIYTFIVLAPLVWVFFMSFRNTGDIRSNPYALPESFNLEKYKNVLTAGNYSTYYLNSLLVVVCSVAMVIIVASMAAYCFAKLPFPGSKVLFYLIFTTIMLPAQVLLIPLFQILVKLKLYDSLIGLSLVYVAVNIPMATYILKSFFDQIPKEIQESARIDGCSEFGIFWRIMFPIATPAISTVLVLNFVNLWNEFLFAVIFIQSDTKRTLPLGVMKFIGDAYEDLGSISAGVILSIVPVLIIYIIFSESFIKGMSAGAVKG